jgi:pimeloyl-ACP methyl ester carboxylesterase
MRIGARCSQAWGIGFSVVWGASLVWLAEPGHLRADAAQTAPPTVREDYANVPGARLLYLDTGGSGPAIILLHAGTGSSRVWELQLPALTGAGYRVIAYDRRGYGRTTVDGVGPVATAADDLDALATHLGLDRFHLVGTAAGGIVSFDYALSFGARLKSLVVANSLGGVVDEDYQALTRRLLPKEFSALPPDVRELGPAYRAAHPEGTERWLALERVSRAAGASPPAQPSKNRVTFARLETLRVPTLIITGDADLYAPPPSMRLFASRIPNAEALAIREVGHSAYWEQPEIFNRAVLEFIGRHR